MTVLLVLASFILLLTIDYIYSRRRALKSADAAQPVAAAAQARPLPGYVAGFELKENLRYHPGHTWALGESPNLVRVGIDDFAARLIGKLESLDLPKRGQWIRQGQRVATLKRDGRTAEMASPIEGMVTDINEAALKSPDLLLNDPYGEGWLVCVQAPDTKTNFKNLLSGSMARQWMEEAAARLRGRMPALAGAVAQDGGVAIRNLSEALSDQDWSELAREFFLA